MRTCRKREETGACTAYAAAAPGDDDLLVVQAEEINCLHTAAPSNHYA